MMTSNELRNTDSQLREEVLVYSTGNPGSDLSMICALDEDVPVEISEIGPAHALAFVNDILYHHTFGGTYETFSGKKLKQGGVVASLQYDPTINNSHKYLAIGSRLDVTKTFGPPIEQTLSLAMEGAIYNADIGKVILLTDYPINAMSSGDLLDHPFEQDMNDTFVATSDGKILACEPTQFLPDRRERRRSFDLLQEWDHQKELITKRNTSVTDLEVHKRVLYDATVPSYADRKYYDHAIPTVSGTGKIRETVSGKVIAERERPTALASCNDNLYDAGSEGIYKTLTGEQILELEPDGHITAMCSAPREALVKAGFLEPN